MLVNSIMTERGPYVLRCPGRQIPNLIRVLNNRPTPHRWKRHQTRELFRPHVKGPMALPQSQATWRSFLVTLKRSRELEMQVHCRAMSRPTYAIRRARHVSLRPSIETGALGT